ncbi:MAG: hypothetical protein K1X88_26075 [Nannocystaceae bacterium]|nr:hypothetical protein [Nannocystaceae bacterium]
MAIALGGGWVVRVSCARAGLLAATVAVGGCGSAPSGNADGGSADAGALDGSEDSTSTASGSGADADGGATGRTQTSVADSSESSSGEAPPSCGDGVVDPGEACDGGPGCEDCQRTCSFAAPIELEIPGLTWSNTTSVPIALTDGSGDLVVASAAGVHRVSPQGQPVWDYDEPPATWRVLSQGAAGSRSVWVGWIVGNETWDAHYTRHAVEDGTLIESFEITDGNDAWGEAVHGTGAGALYVSTSVQTDTEMFARLQRRNGIGGAVQWTLELHDDDTPDAYRARMMLDLSEAPDGSLFAAGSVRPDYGLLQNEIVHITAQGSLAWTRPLDFSAKYGGARRIHALDDGGVVAIARQQYTAFGTVGNTPGYFTHIVRLDGDGNIVWQVDPSEGRRDGRVQVAGLQPWGDRFVLGGALVDDHGDAVAWLGYLDAAGALACEWTMQHPSGDAATIDAIVPDASGGLLVQGFTDDAALDNVSTSRWIAAVHPY